VRHEFKQPLRLLWLASKRAGCNKDLRRKLTRLYYATEWHIQLGFLRIELDVREELTIQLQWEAYSKVIRQLERDVTPYDPHWYMFDHLQRRHVWNKEWRWSWYESAKKNVSPGDQSGYYHFCLHKD